MIFLFAFFHRVFSGLQSMFGYKKSKIGFVIVSLVMMLYPFLNFTTHWLFYLYIIINFIVVYMKTSSFRIISHFFLFKKYQDIHLWESLLTGGYVLYLILAHYNVLFVVCSVYPALIIHKGLINIGSGLSFFDTTTDDDTTNDGNPIGATYGFKLFGFKIKRSSNLVRLILAIVSILSTIIIYINDWNLTF